MLARQEIQCFSVPSVEVNGTQFSGCRSGCAVADGIVVPGTCVFRLEQQRIHLVDEFQSAVLDVVGQKLTCGGERRIHTTETVTQRSASSVLSLTVVRVTQTSRHSHMRQVASLVLVPEQCCHSAGPRVFPVADSQAEHIGVVLEESC